MAQVWNFLMNVWQYCLRFSVCHQSRVTEQLELRNRLQKDFKADGTFFV